METSTREPEAGPIQVGGLNPWAFVPVLYLMQAVPVTIVQEVATVFYKDLGVANAPIVTWTSLISLPWSMQLLLGPLVDLNGTKRRWILGGQAMIACGLLLLALVLRVPHFFEISLLILGATAVSSALCNIATDGFYILAMSKQQQAKFVGVQTTCYRLGRLFCTGILVLVVGLLSRFPPHLSPRVGWTIVLAGAAGIYLLGHLLNRRTLPVIEEDRPAAPSEPQETKRNLLRTAVLLQVGMSGYFLCNALVRLTAGELYQKLSGHVSGDLKGWRLKDPDLVLGFDLGLGPVGTELSQAVICAVLLFGGIVAIRRLIRNTPMGDAFASFARQQGIVPIFFFILFYRFGEAMVSKMSPLFLKDSLANGGLAIANDQLGLIKGIAGVLGIVLGGLVGGWVVGRIGLRRAFWPIAVCMHIPNLLYLFASHVRPPVWALYFVDFSDQFGYGFGFAGYMVYIMWVAQRGHYKTSHYAIGTGMGALCIAIAGVVSGVVQSNFGYQGFFAAVILLTIPGLLSLFFIPLDQPAPAATA